MSLNQILSLRQKYQLFANIPAASLGLYTFLIGSCFPLMLIVKSPDVFSQGPVLLLILIFPAVGLALMYPALKALPRMIRAIENGVCIEGQLLSVSTTSTKIGGRPLKRLKLGYELYNQLYTCEERMIDPSENIQRHWLMVDADDPNNAVYVETLPTALKLLLINRNTLE